MININIAERIREDIKDTGARQSGAWYCLRGRPPHYLTVTIPVTQKPLKYLKLDCHEEVIVECERQTNALNKCYRLQI
jgi:hypothetical protein